MVLDQQSQSLPSLPITDECWCGGRGLRVKRNEYTWNPVTEYCLCPVGVKAKQLERDNRYWTRMEEATIPQRLYCTKFDTHPDQATVKRLTDWYWENDPQGQGFFIYGEYGTGKSTLAAQWLDWNLREYELDGKFITVPDLLDEIKATFGPDSKKSEGQVLDAVKAVHLLVLDDLGAERPTEWVVEKLFSVINHRYSECRPTVFTSNLSLGDLADRLGERITWRIAEMSDVIHLTGPNLRAKK